MSSSKIKWCGYGTSTQGSCLLQWSCCYKRQCYRIGIHSLSDGSIKATDCNLELRWITLDKPMKNGRGHSLRHSPITKMHQATEGLLWVEDFQWRFAYMTHYIMRVWRNHTSLLMSLTSAPTGSGVGYRRKIHMDSAQALRARPLSQEMKRWRSKQWESRN